MSTGIPDSKVHVANMGPTWDRQDPSGPHVGPVKIAIWGILDNTQSTTAMLCAKFQKLWAT